MWRVRKWAGAELEPGARLGPYRLEEELGVGGMGIVFRAVREPDGEVVALKVLKRQISDDDVQQRRFAHEARAASEVSHPHLVPILEAGEVEGRHYLAVKYIQGSTLADRIRDEGPLPLDDVCSLVSDIAGGLDALHSSGLVHRDVKPSNIMLDANGDALLTDFGLSRGRAYTVLTRPGQVMGTLDYLAPELIRGKEATPASDIYALGCVVFEAIAGQPPFAHKSAIEVGVAHLEEEPPDPLASRPGLPSRVSWAAKQALAKDPAERPPTATTYANLIRLAARAGSR